MRPALLVIDLQRGLFEPAPPPFEAGLVIARINALMAKAREAGAPVFLIQHEAADTLRHGSAGWQLVQGLSTGAGDIAVRKTTPDSFLGTGLQELLKQRNIDQLVICGFASEFCVDTTTRRAAALGYPVVLVADAHTTHDKPHASSAQIRAHHNATLAGITSFGPSIQATPAARVTFAS